ncbi:MAG: hypothetical protein JO128_22000 [Alphaproteobacteria bacterium]|nr:hypothetical protein [Alphaproteobacteria bacterium]
MTVTSSAQKHDDFWPNTFEERGAAVPFTTPVLAFSRLRREEEHGLELLVPGLAGGRDTYVIPWRSVPSVFVMTVHDRALREEIEYRPTATPDEIRDASIKVESTGLAGPASARAAKQATNDDDNDRLLTNFFLVSEAVRQLSGGKLKVSPADLTTDGGRMRTKLILSRVAALFQLTPDDFYARLEDWAGVVAPLGIPGLNYTCRLRQLMADLAAYADNVEAWSERDVTDAADSARICARIAEETCGTARNLAAGIDRYSANIRETLSQWAPSSSRIRALMDKLAWTLDGWGPVMTMWRDVDQGDREATQDSIAEMLRLMPVIPRREVGSRARKTWGDLSHALYRTRVRASEDWLSGKVDFELVLRLEKFKAAGHERPGR